MTDESTVVDDGEATRTLDPSGTPPDAAPDATPDAISELRRQQVFRSLFAKPAEPVRIDRFVLLECIGVGGMGELFLALDEELDRKVALKIVRTGRRQHRADDRLFREAQTLARLSHPNVVQVFQAGRVEGRVYVAMEYVRGQTLAAWLDACDPIGSPARLRRVLAKFIEAGRGLAAVHAAGLAHRDFKPDNVLIGEDGRLRVVDFGLARAVESESGEALDIDPTPSEPGRALPDLTATGTVMGTPRFMAPEQWEGKRGDARSDQFSFCVALYEAIYGMRPFDGHTVVGLSRSVTQGERREPPRRAEVPPELRAAILRGLEVDPEARFGDFAELLAVLERVLAPPRSLRLPIALALGFLAALVGLALWLERGEGGLDFHTSEMRRELDAARHLETIESRVMELEAAGHFGDANAAFEAFATLPEHAGTHALGRGWLFQAERRAARGEREAELAALVEAHLVGAGPEQRAALLGLARHFTHVGIETRLPATLASLAALERELGPAPPELADELRELELADAVRRRDFTRARERLAPDDRRAALMRELATRTPTDHRSASLLVDLRSLPGIDLDGDGREELALLPQDDGPIRVLGSQPELPTLHTIEHAELGLSGRPDHVQVVPASNRSVDVPSWLACRRGTEFSLVELDAESGRAQARVLHRWTHEIASPTRWVLGDLDSIPGFEAYGAEATGLRVIRVGPSEASGEAWRLSEADPETHATNSVLNGARVGDLDGDGDDELIVAASEWSAYDVRVLEPDPEQPDRLHLVARTKLGTLSGLTLLPNPSGPGLRIGVMVTPRYPNRRLFPADAPGGLEEGYYLLGWAGHGEPLEIIDRIDGPKDSHEAHVGDLDGDGILDLALASTLGSWSTTLLHGTPQGSYEPLRIAGLWPVGFAALDDDPDAELLMVEVDDESQRGGPLLVVGAGSGVHEPIPAPAFEPRPPPEGLDPAFARSWARAEQLAAIGLGTEASEALLDLATLAEPELATSARIRAAELLEPIRRVDAIALYERAGTIDALARAVELLEGSIAFADALRVTERLLADHGPLLDADERRQWSDRAARLRDLAAPEDRRVFEFDQPLDEGWRVDAELALRPEPGALRVDTLTREGQRLLARRPVVWDGGPIEIEVELDLLRLEWGAGIEFELHPIAETPLQPGQRPLTIGIDAWGGGGRYELSFIGISDVYSPHTIGLPVEHANAELPPERRRHRLGLSVLPDRDRLWTTLSGPGISARVDHPLGPREPGRYELRIQTSGFPWVRGAARIERLTLRGLIDDPEAASATLREQIVLALSQGDPERAAMLLREPGDLDRRDGALLELLALDELGRFTEATAKLDDATDHCSDRFESILGLALLGRPDRFGPTLRELCSPSLLYRAVWAATQTTLHQHPESTDVPRTLTTQLLGLERAEPIEPADALMVIRLLRARAHGWAQQDARPAERADLQRALELGLALIEHPDLRGDATLANAVGSELAHCHRELALALLERGDQDAAIEQLGLALERSPTPELVADRIVVERAFDVLREQSDWSTRLDRARSGRGR